MSPTPVAAAMLCALAACAPPGSATQVYLSFEQDAGGPPIGAQLQPNRAQDWRITGGRIEALEGSYAAPMRTVFLLTRELRPEDAMLEMSVRLGNLGEPRVSDGTWAGFLIGVGEPGDDHRQVTRTFGAPVPGGGLIVALSGAGQVVVRGNSPAADDGPPDGAPDDPDSVALPSDTWPLIEPASSEHHEGAPGPLVLSLRAFPEEAATGYRLEVQAQDAEGEPVARASYRNLPAENFRGALALVSHRAAGATPGATGPGHWFDDWWIWGNKLLPHPERALAPEPDR